MQQQSPPLEQAAVGDTTPSTSEFLRQIQLNPKATQYKVHDAVVAQLYRFLWSSILSHISPAHFLPREIAPTIVHALALLERCDWKLCDAQKRATAELNERRRERLGGLSSSSSSSSSSMTTSTPGSSSAQNSKSIKGKFVPTRLATPPPPGNVTADELGAEYGEERKGMPCGHVFRKGEAIYRCRDCALDNTCVLCAPCFNASEHEGHDIVFSVSTSSGGCCDCGDEEAWTTRICCKYHDTIDEGLPAEAGSSSMSVYKDELEMKDETDIDTYDSDNDEIEVKGKRPERNEDLLNRHIGQIDSLIRNIPADVQDCLITTVSTLLTYVLDTMEHAPMDMKLPEGPDAVERIKNQPTLEQADDEEAGLNPMGAYSYDLSKKRSFSVVLWNDEKHSFREVIDTVSGATDRTEHEAKAIAERVDQHGRDIIDTTGEVKKLFFLAHRLGQIDLAVTVRPAYDIYAEEIAGHVLDFILDLANATLFIPPATPSTQPQPPHPLDQLVPNAAAMRSLIGRALFQPWQHRKPIERGHMSLDYFDTRKLLQLDGLLLMDNRMWKSARITCRSIYMALLGPREIKRALAYRFAKMYSKLVEVFTIHDREPDHSIRAVTVQLFSVPSIATELVADLDLLCTMTKILQSVFTSQSQNQLWTLPPTSPLKVRTGPTSLFLRQQRCYHIFYDMRYLLGAQGVQELLVRDSRHLTYFLDFLALFNAITPDRRAVTEHIEFESEIWVQIFHIATNLSRSAKLFGESYAKANRGQLSRAINRFMYKTIHSCQTLHLNDPEVHSMIDFCNVHFADSTFKVVDFAVESGEVSFHHPLHWLLAETCKHLHTFTYDALPEIVTPPLRRIVWADIGDDGLLVLFEFPLRVIVKLAQIRGGMWVRNGFGIRSQAHHYRDNSMRDIMYDQDFYLLQVSVAFVPPSRMLTSMVHRFSLIDWLQGRTEQTGLEPSQYLFLAEEFLLLLIHLLSETSIAMNWSMEKQVRREIIHFLALSQGQYSDLTRHIGERLKEHSTFDRILATVSSFRAPDGTYDYGIFELKDEYFDEVQPYFFHYTRNQREKAEQVLKERHKKKHGAAAAETFVAVPEKRLQSGQCVLIDAIRDVFSSTVLHHILFFSLYNVRYRLKDTSDSLVDGALQLLMMGLVEQGGSFAKDMTNTIVSDYSLFSFLLSVRDEKEHFVAFKAKIDWIIHHAAELDETCRERLTAADRLQAGAKKEPAQESIEDKKRAAAKARQAAIMQQFSAQQKSLLLSLEADDEDEDDDDDDAEEYGESSDAIDGGMDGDAVMKDSKEENQGPDVRPLGACIFCQENLDHHKAFGSLGHIQSSRLMRTTPRHDIFSLQQSLQTPLTLDRNDDSGKRVRGDISSSTNASKGGKWEGFPTEDHRFGFYASTCGHLMHLDCFDNYCTSIELRHAQQIARNHPEDLSRLEYVCPLCKSLGNVILPVPRSRLQPGAHAVASDQTPLSDWIRKINIDILKTSTMQQTTQLQENEHGTGSFLPWYAEDAQILLENTNNDPNRAHLAATVPAAARQMLERLIRVLRPLSTKSRSLRQNYQARTIHAPPSRKLYIPEEVISYTIGVLEIAQRGIKPVRKDEEAAIDGSASLHVADGVSMHTRELIQSLIYSLRDIAKLENQRYQSLMKHGLLMRLLPHWGGHEPVRSPLLLRDPMTILIEAAIIAPENLNKITTLMFYVQLVQIVFGLAQPSIWPQNSHAQLFRGSNSSPMGGWKGATSSLASSMPLDGDGVSKSDATVLEACFDDVRATVGNIIGLVGYTRGNITLGVDNVDDQSLAKIICTYCLPFLRRATILQKCVGVLKPQESKGGDAPMAGLDAAAAGGGVLPEKAEFLRLMELLDIPLPKEALPVHSMRQTALAGLVEGWIKHAYPQLAQIFRPLPIQPSPLSASSSLSLSKNSASHHPTLQLEHPHIYELIRLPMDLTKLLMQCQVLRCKECGNLPPEPAICLECGELVCFQSFCCQGPLDGKGECNRHVESCGHSSGLFFKVKSNIIILLYQGNGCFTFTPYLDAHGEIDIGLKKGKIQYLHMARFDELRKQWLQHGLANIITRKIEQVIDQGGWVTM